MRFKKGFTYLNKPYGWHNKKLYRLPYKHHKVNRWYNLLECAKWDNKGFFLGKDRKSFAQLKEMTSDIEEINLGEESGCPFCGG